MMSRIFYAMVWTYLASVALGMAALHSTGMKVDASIFWAAPYAMIAGFPVAAGIIFAIAFVSVNAYIEAQPKPKSEHDIRQARIELLKRSADLANKINNVAVYHRRIAELKELGVDYR